MQVVVSASVTLMKPDMWTGFKDFYRCKHLSREQYGNTSSDMDASNHSVFTTVSSSVPMSSVASLFTKKKKGSTLKDEIRMLEEDHAKWVNEESSTKKDSSIPMTIDLPSTAPGDEEMGIGAANPDVGTVEVNCMDCSKDNSGKDAIKDDSDMGIDKGSNGMDLFADEGSSPFHNSKDRS